MRRFFIGLVLVMFTVVGCGRPVFDSHAEVQHNDRMYHITNEVVTTVGDLAGAVGPGGPFQLGGWFSNVLPAGTELFLIPGKMDQSGTATEIAVLLKDGTYVKAILIPNQSQ